MSATAPGFTMFEWGWLRLADPSTSWWAQLPALAVGALGPVSVYLLVRVHRLPASLAVLGSAVIAASPVAVTYSTRVKPYALDLLVACALLALAERARQESTQRRMAAITAVSLFGFVMSGSVAPVIFGVWAALGAHAVGTRRKMATTVAWGTGTVVTCGLVYLVFYRDLPPFIASFWHDFYLDLGSPAAAWTTIELTAARLVSGLVPGSFLELGPLAVVVLVVVVGAGLAAGRQAWAAALTLATAAGAAALEISPLGTGRLDEVLYPAIVLLGALGISVASARVGRPLRDQMAVGRPIAASVTGFLVVALLAFGTREPVEYPGTDLAALRDLAADRRTEGDLLVVDARTRYLWALTEADEIDVVFGDQWLTGFTVRSTEPGVFLQPSYSVEPGHTPLRWTELTESAEQVLYLSTPFEIANEGSDAAFAALLRAGWVPAETIDVTGGRLVVLNRRFGSDGGVGG